MGITSENLINKQDYKVSKQDPDVSEPEESTPNYRTCPRCKQASKNQDESNFIDDIGECWHCDKMEDYRYDYLPTNKDEDEEN